MTCGTPESGASAERLDEILAEYLLARERGEATPDEAFIAAHPEAAGELREFFCNRRDFAALASPGGKGGADVESTLRLSAALGMIEDVELAGRALQPCQRIFGDYELLQEIGRGGIGVVFKARQISLDRIVALKMILSGRLASPEEVKRFQFEAQAAATLDHGSIVQIFNVGELHGQHYFTMKLIEGGSLAKRIAEFEAKPRETAQLVAEIAGAVHHAHQRLILHRDLKPSNVLIDGAGKPHVSDFGLACRQGAHELTESGAVLGAPGYMSPEQASGRVKAITTASDVYSLGAILYDLLTGRPPFRGETVTETIRQVIERQPLRPRSIKGRVDPDLEAVCLKCLEKEPSRRYASAAGLVRDLERYLAGQPVEARRPGRAERAWRWCLRYPMWAASLAAAGVFLVIMTIAALAAAKEYEHELMRNQAKADSFGALHAANTIHSQLTHYASAVVDAAKNPELRGELTRLGRLLNEQHSNARELSNKGELSRLEQVIAGLYRRYNRAGGPYRSANENEPFDSLFVQTTRGIGLIRSPNSPREWTGADFQYRDYFQGAMKRAEAAAKGQPTPYVSGVFVSYSNDLAKFAISMPIIADDGSRRMVGVLAATITTGATFGPIPLGDEHRKVVLVGPKDPSQAGPPNHSATRPDQPPEYVVVVDRSQRRQLKHVSYVRSERLTAFAVPLQQGDLPRSQYATDDNYEDPNEGGRWQAGFAQVGNTGLVVVVQTPYGQPLQPGRTLARELGFWLAVAATVGGALLLAGAVYRHRAGWSRWRIALEVVSHPQSCLPMMGSSVEQPQGAGQGGCKGVLPHAPPARLRRTLGPRRTDPSEARAQPQGRPAPPQRPGRPGRRLPRAEDRLPVAAPAPLRTLAQRQHLLAAVRRVDPRRRLAATAPRPAQRAGPGRRDRPLARGRRLGLRPGRKRGAHTGPNPTDRSKNGCKRHVISDRGGIPLVVLSTPANVPDQEVFLAMLDSMPPVKMPMGGRPAYKPEAAVGDRAYGTKHLIAEVVKRRIESLLAPRNSEHGSGLGVIRYVIERTMSWIGNYRRLKLCYERKGEHWQAFNELAACLICANRIEAVREEGRIAA